MSDHFQRDPAQAQPSPWMRPMQPGQLTPNNQTRQPAVPVSPYTPNEPDQNEAIYAARAAQARRHLSQAAMENPNGAVQQAMLQTARQAHANQSVARPAPQQPVNLYSQQGQANRSYPYSQPSAQPYQRPAQQSYSQQVSPYRQPVPPYQRPVQPGYPQQPAEDYRRHSVPMQPEQQPVQPSVRTADHAILADPMLLEEVQQPTTTRRRRSRMVMRQEQAAETQPIQPAAQEQAEPAPVQEPATVAQAAQEAKEQVQERLAQEAATAEEWNLWNPAPEAVSGMIPVIEAEEAAEADVQPELPAEEAPAANEAEAPLSDADLQPDPQPDPQPEPQPVADEMPDLPQRPAMEEAGFVDPLAGIVLPEETPDEEDETPADDFVETARMPVPQPVSTLDIPTTKEPKKKGYKLMTLLMVLMLLAAAAGFLWLSGLGEKLINGASNIVETLSSSTVSIEAMTVSPEHAALPAKLTFHLKTDATITELRLVTADGSQLPADASVTIAENGLDWECKCTLTEPYTGTVYAELLCADGQWRKASESCYIEIN